MTKPIKTALAAGLAAAALSACEHKSVTRNEPAQSAASIAANQQADARYAAAQRDDEALRAQLHRDYKNLTDDDYFTDEYEFVSKSPNGKPQCKVNGNSDNNVGYTPADCDQVSQGRALIAHYVRQQGLSMHTRGHNSHTLSSYYYSYVGNSGPNNDVPNCIYTGDSVSTDCKSVIAHDAAEERLRKCLVTSTGIPDFRVSVKHGGWHGWANLNDRIANLEVEGHHRLASLVYTIDRHGHGAVRGMKQDGMESPDSVRNVLAPLHGRFTPRLPNKEAVFSCLKHYRIPDYSL